MTSIAKMQQAIRRQKVIDAVCSLLAAGDLSEASRRKIPLRAVMDPGIFYRTFPGGVKEAIRGAFEFSAMHALYAARSGGVEELSTWAEANPDAVGTILLAGPRIDLDRYNELVEEAAGLLGEGPMAFAAISGALAVAARRLREKRPVDAELIQGDLAAFCRLYVQAGSEA